MFVRFIIYALFLCSVRATTALAYERIAPPLDQLLAENKPTVLPPAQILLRKTRIDLDNQFFSQSHAYVAIYINSDEAVRDYSQMSLGFNSFYENLELEFAQVRTPDGKLHAIEKDAVQIQNPAEENFYQDTKELTFSLPNVQIGSVIEFQYHRRDIKKIITDAWFDAFWFNWWEERAANQGPRLDPVSEAIVELRAPINLPLFAQPTAALQVAGNKRTEGNQQILTWQQKNIAEIVLQNNMPRSVELFPMVQLSTLNTWQKVAQWGNDLFAPHINQNERIQSIAQNIRQKARSKSETVQQVYQYLQNNVRYVFAHVGRGGYEPHSATDVLNNAYGDCKDQTVLAVTLLRQSGVEAYPALVATRSRGLPKLNAVSVAFDHMITYIPAQSGMAEIWLDTAGEISLFPGFSTAIEGQPALIIRPESDKLTLIKQRTPQQHLAHLQLDFDRITPQAVEAKFTLTLNGMFEESLRSSWLFTPEKQKVLTDMLGSLYAAGELTQLATQNADNLWQPFSVSGRFTFKNAWQGDQKPLNYGFSLEQPLSVFSDIMHIHKPAERKQDYVADPGYLISTDILFSAPSGDYELAVTSRGGNYNNPWFEVSQQGEPEGRNFRLRQTFILRKQTIPLASYGKFYAAINNLMEAPSWQVVYMPQTDMVTKPSNSNKDPAAGNKTAEILLKVRQLLDKGDFAQALNTAEQAVAAMPKNGEAFYVLGLAQGYQGQIDAANKSFLHATELGFTP